MIRKCSKCSDYRSPAAEFQTKAYGKGMRVQSPCARNLSDKVRCTVCEELNPKKAQ